MRSHEGKVEMAHKWSELRDKMSPEARARSDAKFQEMLEELERNDLLDRQEEQPTQRGEQGSTPCSEE